MPRGKKFAAEQIIGKLREAEVGLAQGKTVPEVVRKLGVTEQTYDRRLPSPRCLKAWLGCDPVLALRAPQRGPSFSAGSRQGGGSALKQGRI